MSNAANSYYGILTLQECRLISHGARMLLSVLALFWLADFYHQVYLARRWAASPIRLPDPAQ
jgi:hypothetical protein